MKPFIAYIRSCTWHLTTKRVSSRKSSKNKQQMNWPNKLKRSKWKSRVSKTQNFKRTKRLSKYKRSWWAKLRNFKVKRRNATSKISTKSWKRRLNFRTYCNKCTSKQNKTTMKLWQVAQTKVSLKARAKKTANCCSPCFTGKETRLKSVLSTTCLNRRRIDARLWKLTLSPTVPSTTCSGAVQCILKRPRAAMQPCLKTHATLLKSARISWRRFRRTNLKISCCSKWTRQK
jgi:hypothetical protein